MLEKILVFGIKKIFVKKKMHLPQKTNVMASISKIFKSNLFYCVHRMSGFHKNTTYGHYLCMFLNAGFQNLGKLNTGFNVLLLSKASLRRGGGKVALGFGPGRIRTLVSMATDSSH